MTYYLHILQNGQATKEIAEVTLATPPEPSIGTLARAKCFVWYSYFMPLDIGLGLLLGIWLSSLTSFSYGVCLGIGVLSMLLPDLDYISSWLKQSRQPDSRHRDGLHYPLIFVLATGALGCLVNLQTGLIFALGGFLHFVHDSVGIGFGIKWLYPFKKNSYLFLFQIKTPTNTNMPKQRFYSWNDSERAEMIQKYGYPGWIKYVYLRPNPFGIFEYSVLIIGIVLALAHG